MACCRFNLGRIISLKNDHQNCMIVFVFVKMLKRVKLSMWIKLQGAGNINVSDFLRQNLMFTAMNVSVNARGDSN